jgi:hypothetical protein
MKICGKFVNSTLGLSVRIQTTSKSRHLNTLALPSKQKRQT